MRFFLDPAAHAAAQEAAARAKEQQQQLEEQQQKPQQSNKAPLLQLDANDDSDPDVLKSRSMSGDGTQLTATATPSSSCFEELARICSYDKTCTDLLLYGNYG